MVPGSDTQKLLREALSQFACTPEELSSDVERDTAELRSQYDFAGINTVLAIEPWGRSGSVLLASYFDGHREVLALPALRSNGIYVFFAAHSTLSLRDKLIAYPLYDETHDPHSDAAGCGRSFFEGPFAIDRRRYLAAALAIAGAYESLPAEFTNSGRGFFIALHVVFDRALGRRPVGRTPMIVCAQHESDNPTAAHLLEEFRDVRFVQTVRDPVTSLDRLFDWFFDPSLLTSRQPTAEERSARQGSARYISVLAPWMALYLIVAADRPHAGTEGRTRVVRFEDLHHRTEGVMRDLAGWLGLEFGAELLESTFADRPYVVNRDGKSWSGARRDRLKRSARNLSVVDRGLIYSLFHRNFVAWGYPSPRGFGSRWVRLAAILMAVLWPTKMEVIVAKAAWRRRVWPWLKQFRLRIPADTVMRLAYARAAIAYLALKEIPRRLIRSTHPIELTGEKFSPFDDTAA